ncbi:MAG TPA: cyanophycinase [Flavobacterium sp.]|jgi:cyanophycinase
MKLRGKLIIIGGAEDKGDSHDNETEFAEDGILRRIVDESLHKEDSRIEIVTSASRIPHDVGDDYIKAFAKLKAKNTGYFVMETREDAANPENLARLEAADVVFFTGGDQLRLTSILGGTPFYYLMYKKLETEDFIYAGTSAGAAAASDNMVMRGSSTDAITKGEVKTSAGFGLIEDVLFDTHFIARGRIGRLFQLIVSNPKVLGVGLEENSALLITSDYKMEAIGPGMCILIDGRFIKNTNLLDIKEGVPLSIDNFILHVMSKTDVYDLKERQLTIITPEECRL